jgi:large repetitive protein
MLQPLLRRALPLAALIALMSVFIATPSTFAQRYYPPRAPGFIKSDLKESNKTTTLIFPDFPTTLQMGPDDRLYVATHKGRLFAYTVARDNALDVYYVTATEEINLIRSIPNHNDDGTPNPAVTNERQVTGILVVGTAQKPVIYVTSSDPRSNNTGGSTTAGDINLDTNSGVITRLTRNNTNGWDMVHLVRGLPRSEEYHSTNGLTLDTLTNTLFVTAGGHTNMGGPGRNFAYTPEYALSAALLSVDLNAIEAMPVLIDHSSGQSYVYDLPTLDDPTRGTPGQPDPGDPFGGNDGLNQAMIVPGSPVQVYSPGYRNIYDVVLTKNTRRLYVFDNGPNSGWGGSVVVHPETPNEGFPDCTNETTDENSSSTFYDQLHYIPAQGFYGGHVNPVRANPQNAGLYHYTPNAQNQDVLSQVYEFTEDWSPVPFNLKNPVECEFRSSGTNTGVTPAADSSLTRINGSTNGLAEYTASNFGGALQGDLLAASYHQNSIYIIKLTPEGTAAVSKSNSLMAGFGSRPLDVTAQDDLDIFPGTVWAVSYLDKKVTIFDPTDFDECEGVDDPALDEDFDNYNNADELDAGSNPCSGGSVPADWDQDFVSNVNDPDDDNDTIPDLVDAFAIDATNGSANNLPLFYSFFDNDPGTGFYGVGFTGLMTNGSTDYLAMYDDNNLTAGGAAGAFTVDAVSAGDATGSLNTQQNAFQFGLNVNTDSSGLEVQARMVGPFFNGAAPVNGQMQGMYIGTGDQDNYLRIALAAQNGEGVIQVLREESGAVTSTMSYSAGALLSANFIDLGFVINPGALYAQPRIRVDNGGWQELGSPVTIPGAWLNPGDGKGLALGVIATSGASGVPFTATWDYFAAESFTIIPTPTPTFTATETPSMTSTPDLTQTATPTVDVTNTAEAPTPTPTEDTGIELVENGDFEAKGLEGKPDLAPWVLKNGTQDKIKCNKDKDGDGTADKIFAHQGECAFMFKGGAGESAKLEQTIGMTGVTFAPGDTLTLTGFANASRSSVSGKIKVVVKYGDDTPKSKISMGLAKTDGYEPFTETEVISSANVVKLKLSVNHRSLDGKVFLDGLSLKQGNITLIPLP